MADQESLSLEELVRQHNVVVDSPIASVDLETGMVMVCEGKARIVISAFFEKVESGAMVVVETMAGLQRFAIDAQVAVWRVNGDPFIVDVPLEDSGTHLPADGENGSAPPAQDAAGIVPVWRGPKRLN
jgi:hypothetical protein